MKTIKKTIALFLAVLMFVSIWAAGVAYADERSYAPHKIGVMWGSLSATEMLQIAYLQDYVGPAFNCEFVFSEALKDTGAAVAFVEQAHAAGCEALLNFYSDGQETATAMAEEYGMYIITNASRMAESVKDIPTNLGLFGVPVTSSVATFSSLAEPLLNDGQKHNIVIVSGGAGMGNASHLEMTVALMQMVCDVNSTTIDGDLTTLAKSASRTEVIAADGTKIMIYPGYPAADTYVSGFSSVLQTGEYDTVFCTYSVFPQLVQPIAEVEKAFGTDIRLVSVASVGDATTAAFNNGALNGAMINPCAMYAGALFVVAYNALEGNAAAIQQGEGACFYNFLKWSANSAEEYNAIATLDVSPETYALTVDDIASLLVSNDPSVNFDTINDYFSNLTAQSVLARYGA